jgi:hypothetical protein
MTQVRPQVDSDDLAQARGCVPENDCYNECVDAAQRTLDRWDELDEADRAYIIAVADRS